MDSKQAILGAIRRHQLPSSELPDLSGPWISYPNKMQQFAEMLQFVGGRCVPVPDLAAADAELRQFEPYAKSKRIFSNVAGVGSNNVDLEGVADPHDLEDLDFAILPGTFGVAENGAVWVTDSALKHRVVYFITQHLALVIQKDQLLDNMHQAYDRLSFPNAGFGLFISGPSKTADIEQSLVVGAHGSRSMTVYVVGE
jgi:L-lactate dehydrogenase complex protein LldG